MGRKLGSKNKHHKEKPIKEKKKRGRPSIKQHQERPKALEHASRVEQHQIVNVNIGSSTHSNEKKERKRKQQPQQPPIIFNPSVVMPTFEYPNRQPVNPSYFPESPQFNINDILDKIKPITNNPQPNPINPNPINPTIPIETTPNRVPRYPISTEPTPTNINPPINPQGGSLAPSGGYPQYNPNPQTDQSHPEILIDSNITTPTYENDLKHRFKERAKELYNQAVENQIKPQVPKDVKPPKYNDTEGLGMRIPVQNIVGIAATIGSGALGGGIIAGGEALLTGSGLAAATESAAAGAVGGGVGAGVNSALGGGDVGHVVSSIAGGIVGRTSIRTRTRAQTEQTEPFSGTGQRLGSEGERQPLLSNNRLGQRLGGRIGVNRLTAHTHLPEETNSNQTIDQTGNTTTWILPQAPTTMQKIIKDAKRATDAVLGDINKQAEVISNTLNNVTQRMTGRFKKGGTYARLKQEETLNRFDKDILGNTQSKETLNQEDFDNFLKRKPETTANDELFKLIDRRNYGNDPLDIEQGLKSIRQNSAANKIKDMIKLKKHEPGRHILQNTVRQNIRKRTIERMQNEIRAQGAVNDIIDNAVEHSGARQLAATKLQAALKKTLTRNEYKQEKAANKLLKLSKGATEDLKDKWKQTIKQHQRATSNFGQLTRGLQQEQHMQRLGAASVQPVQQQGGTRSGAAFGATQEQLNAPSRMQLHRERNPELTQLRQQLSDHNRGRTELTTTQLERIKTRIQQLVDINKALKAKGEGPKLGRPKK